MNNSNSANPNIGPGCYNTYDKILISNSSYLINKPSFNKSGIASNRFARSNRGSIKGDFDVDEDDSDDDENS